MQTAAKTFAATSRIVCVGFGNTERGPIKGVTIAYVAPWAFGVGCGWQARCFGRLIVSIQDGGAV